MYQFKLVFATDNNVLPKELDRVITSFFKASLQNYSEELYEQLYGEGKSVIKPFTYSLFLPGAVFQDTKILLDQNNFTLFFSDADLGESIHFLNSFKLMKQKTYPMQGNCMKLTSLTTQRRQVIKDNEIVVKMLSSLIVRRHDAELNKDTYFTYEQDGFGEALKENITYFLQKSGIPVSAKGFSIMPVKAKKVVAPVFGRNVDGNLGIYKLTGSPELLNVLYMAGIGSRRSEGHGKFEILL